MEFDDGIRTEGEMARSMLMEQTHHLSSH
jgi:hypothetical protein